MFAPLDKEISLVYKPTGHEDQAILQELLGNFTDVSGRIKVLPSTEGLSPDAPPQFSIRVNGKENGIHFKGIPNGHEGTSNQSSPSETARDPGVLRLRTLEYVFDIRC